MAAKKPRLVSARDSLSATYTTSNAGVSRELGTVGVFVMVGIRWALVTAIWILAFWLLEVFKKKR
ncbi:hypothetical protein M2447_000307 [Ereboglobus sp. PH5-10]|uniref:hypothetical protein n=1 Tax=Ereboglobus sp. PH5-10 TaxID=2940629 RepID=UPI0024057FF3|nr:hypothetical protein [Ereboglobus sp. PH5-10]MDF9826231.1 hypothetical protein [Ereboglobus sp. PH5-10]